MAVPSGVDTNIDNADVQVYLTATYIGNVNAIT